MILHPQQITFNNDIRMAAKRGAKSILAQGPTGFGKSVSAAAHIKAALGKSKTAIFVVPRRDLVRQMSKHFNEFDIPHSFIAAGHQYNPYAKVHICTVGTLVNRLDKATPDIVFIDETHYGSTQLDKIIKYYRAQGAYIIGLSATPQKTSGQGLDVWYETMVCGPSISWLIENKFLSEYRLFSPGRPNLEGIKTVAGDYSKGQLSEIMEADRVLIGSAVQHYKEHAMGKLNVAFCTSRKHSGITAQAFRDAGIPTSHIDGETPDDERKRIIRAFANRELLCITSVDLMHTGFDLGSQVDMDITVESMSDLRPTKSLTLQLQKWGRVLRRKDYPAVIVDHAANAFFADGTPNHGFPDDERFWSLEGSKKRGSMGERAIPVRQCTGCYFCHKPAPVCPNCGLVYPIQSRIVEEVEGELHEIDRNNFKPKVYDEAAAKKQLYALISVGKKRGMTSERAASWAANIITKQMAKRRAQ